jgi:3-dehydro-L-gulonate 2-dehydrogenase
MRLTFEEIKSELKRVFLKYGLSEEHAEVCAEVHTESSYDGIYSHGVGRVGRFVDYIKKGWVDTKASPTLEKEFGSLCVYNGNMGSGVVNAMIAVEKGMEIAKKNGIAMVGLKNTTHWMRGGTYGLHAANNGFVAIMWTNTESVMPPWGGKDGRLGNNPFVMAVPGVNGNAPMMLDMAISQYSYGKLAMTRLAGQKLPLPGGYDEDGNMTDDPGAIEKTRRMLPIGYWKGSSFSFMLDVLGTVLTDGIGAADLDHLGKGSCGGASQVMILIDPTKVCDSDKMCEMVTKAIEHLKSSEPIKPGAAIFTPGEDYIKYRAEHDEKGIFVEDSIWEEILAL